MDYFGYWKYVIRPTSLWFVILHSMHLASGLIWKNQRQNPARQRCFKARKSRNVVGKLHLKGFLLNFQSKRTCLWFAKPKPVHTFLCVNTFIIALVDLVDLGQIWRDEIQMADGFSAYNNLHWTRGCIRCIIKNPKATIYLQGTTAIVPTTYEKNVFFPPFF